MWENNTLCTGEGIFLLHVTKTFTDTFDKKKVLIPKLMSKRIVVKYLKQEKIELVSDRQ